MEADLLVTCPYNPAHRIRKYKLMTHMAKCKKTSNVAGKVECPLDKTHVVDRDHLKEHVATCSSLGNLIDLDAGYNIPKLDLEPPVKNIYNSNENWEEEPEVPAYDPMEASSKKAVLRCVSGLTKSEKRKFKENERMRIANLKGLYPVSEASTSVRDSAYEVPLRPPRDTVLSSTTSQNDSVRSMQINDALSHNHNTRMQTKYVPEYQNSFQKMLFDELAPEDDSIKQVEQPLRNTETKISLKDYFQYVNKENGNFPISDQNQETRFKKTEANATLELFNIDNNEKKRDECIAGASSMSDERVTDKLLSLLKNEISVKKTQPTEETIKIDRMDKNCDEKEPIFDEILSNFNERLIHLNSIQNAAAEESARILEQLKNLKIREEITSRK